MPGNAMTPGFREGHWRSGHVPRHVAVPDVLDAMGNLVDAAAALTPRDLASTTPSQGWTAAELLVHLHLGLHHMIYALLTPTGRPVAAIRDRCAYRPDAAIATDAAQQSEHGRFLRGVAAAYDPPGRIIDDLAVTVDAASIGVVDLRPEALLVDGQPVCTGDFLGAWALELNRHLHHLAQRTAGGVTGP